MDTTNKEAYRLTPEYRAECDALREQANALRREIERLQIENAVMMYWNLVDFRYN